MKTLFTLLGLTVSIHALAAEPLLIEAYGDSTTLGVSCIDHQCGPRPENAVAYLQDALRAKYGDNVSVTNLGVGGTMATQLNAGNDRRGGIPWEQRLSQSRAQVVTVNYGINEVMHNQTPEQFYEAETTLVKAALAARIMREPPTLPSCSRAFGRLPSPGRASSALGMDRCRFCSAMLLPSFGR